MEISFRNDGAFNEYAINAPVLVGSTPIGRIRVVSEYTVVCEILICLSAGKRASRHPQQVRRGSQLFISKPTKAFESLLL